MSHYKIISVQKSVTPQGAQDDNWYCYVIASENNTIIGYRAGSQHEVKKEVEECVRHMNDKYSGKVRYDFSRPAFPNETPFS
jgi:hypothetical protein